MGSDDTTLFGGEEPSSFAAAGDSLLVHLNSSFGIASPGDPQATPKGSNVSVGELERLVKDSASKKKEAEKLEFEAWPNLEFLRIWRMNLRRGVVARWKQ